MKNKREKILDAALARFEHYGFLKTTVDEIARQAQVGKGTVYSYFNSKKEILIALVDQEFARGVNLLCGTGCQPLVCPAIKIRYPPPFFLLLTTQRKLCWPVSFSRVSLALQPPIRAGSMAEHLMPNALSAGETNCRGRPI
jgi:AcrR family transcriptional regulator